MDSDPAPHFYFCCHYLIIKQLCLLLHFVPVKYHWETSLVVQTVKCLPIMWETQVQSLGQEDPLEKEMATHSSTLAWKILWTEELGRLQSMGSQRAGQDWGTSLSLSFTSWIPLKCLFTIHAFVQFKLWKKYSFSLRLWTF